MHVECAQRPKPNIKSNGDGDGDCCEEIIQHFTHWHPLRLIGKKDLQVGCGICEKVICFDSASASASAAYGCEECNFFVHKSCMINIPRQINHLYHPSCPLILLTTPVSYNCKGCDDEHVSGLVFRCGKCGFQLDVKCALLPTLDQSKDANKIQHIAHEHPLLALLPDNNKDTIIASEVDHPCGVCGERCSLELGENPCFGCKRCDIFLHKSCLMMNISREMTHLFHPSCPLILLTTPSSYKCAGCDDEHVSSLAYSCEKCRFQLDVKCALLPTLEQSKDADKIQYFPHKHPLLALPDNNKNKIIASEVVQCRACEGKCSLESDACFGCERCEFFIHRQCAVELKQEIHHYFHPLHPLILSSPPKAATCRCGACLGSIGEILLIYRCAKCGFNLHLDCAKAKPFLLVKHEGHSHHLTFFYKTHAPAQCHICYGAARNCFFRCVACDFNLHLYCHPSAPMTINHTRHLHPLTLTKSPFEFELISPQYQEDYSIDDEFYCDICEEKRFKDESVYYCTECKFIAETRCVMYQLLALLPSLVMGSDRFKSTDEENSALEASIAERSIEIEELTAKKKPLESEIEKLKALEEELKSINHKLEELERDRFLWNYQLNLNKEENNSSGAST